MTNAEMVVLLIWGARRLGTPCLVQIQWNQHFSSSCCNLCIDEIHKGHFLQSAPFDGDSGGMGLSLA